MTYCGVELMNEHGQPVGPPISAWTGARLPVSGPLSGNHVGIRPLVPSQDAAPLFALFAADDASIWTYMPAGPFSSTEELRDLFIALVADPSNSVYAIEIDGRVVGFFEYLRISERDGTIEIGFITFSQALQRTTAATEAVYLLMRHAFDSGFRRLEWKCDALNAKSRSAALRLGFVYEGTFRQATHYKGRNRDTAWFSITDKEWPHCATAFGDWLRADNFDSNGTQKTPLQTRKAKTSPA